MAAAYGRLFLALEDGRLLCLGADGKTTTSLSELKPLAERLPPLEMVEAPGLAGYWKFDEGEGSAARDSSGGNHVGKVTDSWTNGSFGTCIRAMGTPAAVTLPDGDYLHLGKGDFTLEMWVNLEQHDCRLMGKEAFPKNWWVINILADGRAELVLGRGKSPEEQVRSASKTPVPLNAWSHLAYVVDRTNQSVRCFVNGQLEGTTEIPASLSDATFDVKGTDLRIPSAHKSFHGLLDELKIYHRALSDSEIKTSYKQQHMAEEAEREAG